MAEPEDREERHIRAMAVSLHKALAAGAPEEQIEQLTRAAMGAETSSRMVERFRAWNDAMLRYRDAPAGSAEAEELRVEVGRLWAAYQSTVDQAGGG